MPPAIASSLPTSAGHERFGEARWEVWSTSVVLRLNDPRKLSAARIAVERELAAIDRACSRFRGDSEIARVNSSAGRAVRVSPLFVQALALALRAAQLTDGDVDPTVGSALTLAGYDRDWSLLEPPATDSPAHKHSMRRHSTRRHPGTQIVARAVCGWRSVLLDNAACTVRIPAGFQLDLGATAKAFAADRAAQAAAQAAACGALVAIGGDIATAGHAPTHGWAIHVTDDHRSDHHAPGQTVTIHTGGLATSSTTVRRWRHEGRTMHHIIDPATGLPARSAWRTVSVAAASCADANIATTAALVRSGSAPAWLAQLGVPARLVSHSGRVYAIGAWPTGTWPTGAWPARARGSLLASTPQPHAYPQDNARYPRDNARRLTRAPVLSLP